MVLHLKVRKSRSPPGPHSHSLSSRPRIPTIRLSDIGVPALLPLCAKSASVNFGRLTSARRVLYALLRRDQVRLVRGGGLKQDNHGRIAMSRRFECGVLWVVSLAATLLGTSPVSAASSCAGLMNLSLPDAVVTAAQSVTGGSFNTPPGCTTGSSGLHHEYRAPAVLPRCRHRDADERFGHQFRGLDTDGCQLQRQI